MSAVKTDEYFVLTRRRLQNVLEKTEVFGHNATQADKKQVEHLVSAKEIKQNICQDHSDSSNDEDETSEECYDLKELELYAWIQCENAECMKWRRLPRSEVATIDEATSWFCFMNADAEHNSCEDEEDDYQTFEKQARKYELKCVVSTFPIGSLVWAKMVGYCRWPGIITNDPMCMEYVVRDDDPICPEPTSYHVEFLGSTHSHCWVSAKIVQPYGLVDVTPKSAWTKTKSKAKKHHFKHKLILKKSRKERMSYHGGSVEVAVSEANELLDCLSHERLEKCVFRQTTDEEDRGADISRNVNTTVATDVARTAKNKSRQQHLITRVENTSQGILLPYGHHKSAQKDLPKSCKLTSSNKRKHDLKYGGMKAQLCGRKTNDASQIGGHRKKQKHAGPSDVQRDRTPVQKRKLHGVDYQRVHPLPRANNLNLESRRRSSNQVSDEDSELDEVKEILGRIDTAATHCDFSYLEDEVQTDAPRATLLTFYDDSPDETLRDYRLADTASEFGVADLPDMDTTQEVPDLGSLVSSDGEDQVADMSVGLDVDEMLQDVAAMQREIDDLGDDLTW